MVITINDNFIDLIAIFDKEKSAYPERNEKLADLELMQIRKIKQIAAQYSIERVVLFPYFDGLNIKSIIRVYGGDKENFFQNMEWSIMPLNSGKGALSELDRMEREYGIILYESM